MNGNGLLPDLNLFAPAGASSILEMFLKVLFISAFFIFMVFSFMVIRQTVLMEKTYKTTLGPMIKLFAVAYFLVSVGIFALVIIIL